MDNKNHKADLNIISGAIEGLTHYLCNFSLTVQEGTNHTKSIFEYVKKALSKKEELKYYSVPKGSLYSRVFNSDLY